jgi:hypothetical protein
MKKFNYALVGKRKFLELIFFLVAKLAFYNKHCHNAIAN